MKDKYAEKREALIDILEMAYGYAGVEQKHGPVADKIITLVEQALSDKSDDARRYQYIRDNQTWYRFDDCSVIGIKFPYDADFQAKPMLDYYIDKALASPPQE